MRGRAVIHPDILRWINWSLGGETLSGAVQIALWEYAPKAVHFIFFLSVHLSAFLFPHPLICTCLCLHFCPGVSPHMTVVYELRDALGQSAGQYLHGGTVGLAADECSGNVRVCILVLQVHHVRHPPRQEKLVPLHLTPLKQDAVNVPPCGTTHTHLS